MTMALKGKDLGAVVAYSLIWFVGVVLSGVGFSFATPSDIYCLKQIKASLEDPLHSLWSWDFNNTKGNICGFTGVECWHPDENRVLSIRLSNMGLKGLFPRGIENCSSLAGLDLSSNYLSGTIPPNISTVVPFVTKLALSSNNFDGQIPASLANCSYLNFLNLANNQLTGEIPAGIGLLYRLEIFDVANNNLTGPVPRFVSSSISITANMHANNPGLCGGPLKPCSALGKKSSFRII